jgi:hypothetical protein
MRFLLKDVKRTHKQRKLSETVPYEITGLATKGITEVRWMTTDAEEQNHSS